MNLRYLFFLFILLCISVNVLSEDNKEKDQSADQQENSKPKIAVKKRGQIKTLEEFIPSEEVSADKPVAFPNDI